MDMTGWLIEQMNTNAQAEITQQIRKNWSGWPHQQAAALKTWTALVRKYAVWDFKEDILRGFPGVTDVTLGGETLNFQAVANIHFGYVGRAAGIGSELLKSGAGIFQVIDNGLAGAGPMVYWDGNRPHLTYFDEPFDVWSVAFGIYLYEYYGTGELTLEIFQQALQEFTDKYGEAPPLQ
jgi:hypothetical protein